MYKESSAFTLFCKVVLFLDRSRFLFIVNNTWTRLIFLFYLDVFMKLEII